MALLAQRSLFREEMLFYMPHDIDASMDAVVGLYEDQQYFQSRSRTPRQWVNSHQGLSYVSASWKIMNPSKPIPVRCLLERSQEEICLLIVLWSIFWAFGLAFL